MTSHKKWCRAHIKRFREGQFWIVPRTGMVFRRHGPGFIWLAVIPPEKDLGLSADNARAAEFLTMLEMFREVGIPLGIGTTLRRYDNAETAMKELSKLPFVDITPLFDDDVKGAQH